MKNWRYKKINSFAATMPYQILLLELNLIFLASAIIAIIILVGILWVKSDCRNISIDFEEKGKNMIV